MNRFDPDAKSAEELAAARSIMSHVAIYERVGYDVRPMVFLADGSVGVGGAGCEAVWDVVDSAGQLVLDIGSVDSLTCQLVSDDKGVWTGSWLVAERMPVRLSIIKSVPIECTFMDPEIRYALNSRRTI